jgi:hypothetical protein
MKQLLTTGILCLAAMVAGCASMADSFSGKVLYQDVRFGSDQLSDNSLLVFPVIKRQNLDSSGAITEKVLGTWLHDRRNDLEIMYRDNFEHRLLEYYPAWFDTFYVNLLGHNQVALQADTITWSLIDADYALMIFIKEAGRVRDFQRDIKRTIWMEAEIWSVDPVEVVWRVEVKGFERNAKTSDTDFIRRGVEKVYSLFPLYHPSLHEKTW